MAGIWELMVDTLAKLSGWSKPWAASAPQHCAASRRDGTTCTAQPGPSGYCTAHNPEPRMPR